MKLNGGEITTPEYWVDTTPEFVAWPKTPRLNRDMIVTEKIDGTNGCIVITPDGEVYAQSRTRLLERPTEANPKVVDNFGFRAWVDQNAEALFATLGEGRHYGEWWGQGIQRNYGLKEKRFSLFNTSKWDEESVSVVPQLHVIPVIHRWTFDTEIVRFDLMRLKAGGSFAAPGFMNPEGVCVYHTASNQVFKATLDNDDFSKTDVRAQADNYAARMSL